MLVSHYTLSLLKSLTQTNHQCKLPMSKPIVKCHYENHVKMSMSNVNHVMCKQNVMYGK
uniref:Uncharacterized protein n=1 Tax=Helianthus annuus TaxID=4232 RepID=A0A251SZ97_HELAN